MRHSEVPNGPNTITTLSIKIKFSGTFDGTWCGTERDVNFPDGSVTVHASGVFTGTVSECDLSSPIRAAAGRITHARSQKSAQRPSGADVRVRSPGSHEIAGS